jgi:hypothetical protein
MIDDVGTQPPVTEVYLGDAVYASFDGYQIWLRTGDRNNQRIALEPRVWANLVNFVKLNIRGRS